MGKTIHRNNKSYFSHVPFKMTVRYANFYWCLDIQWTIGPTNLELMEVIWAGYRTSLMIQKWAFATWIIFIFDTAMWAFLQTHESQCALGHPNHFRFGLLLEKPGYSCCTSVLCLWRYVLAFSFCEGKQRLTRFLGS